MTTTIPHDVIERFARKKAISPDHATCIFSALEAFLSSSSSVPTIEVDEAWHEFLLHTKQYADYCASRFGRFIHHVPDSQIPIDEGDSMAGFSKCSSNCSRS
jgi:hypothetical protein